MSDLKAGDRVLYSPDLCHATSCRVLPGGSAETLFHFRHKKAGARGGPNGPTHHRKGDRASLHPNAKGVVLLRNDAGVLETHDGHEIEPDVPRSYWPAVVARVNADGTADLDIEHPQGGITLHCPDRDHHPGAPGVPHDPKKAPHTFHLAGE